MNTELDFQRGDQNFIDNLNREDGRLIYNTETGETYMDVGDKRIKTSGGSVNENAISELQKNINNKLDNKGWSGNKFLVTDENGNVIEKEISIDNNGDSNGTLDHNKLINRSLPNQHPIEAITGLRETLNNKKEKNEPLPKLTFIGDTQIEYDGTKPIDIKIPNKNNDETYVLPKATEVSLGGVKAIPATSEMTENVGIDSEGLLKVKILQNNGKGISGAYSSVQEYSPDICKKYATNDTFWYENEITEQQGESWAVGNIILLAIKCTNGDNYITIQEILQLTKLHPLTYWVSKKGEPGADGTGASIKNIVDGPQNGSVGTINSCYNSLGINSFSEGSQTEASGDNSHTEGELTIATGDDSHAEGESTNASGYASHAEGNSTKASGFSSHAEGWFTTVSGTSSHGEGWFTTASGHGSHAEGKDTTASGYASHAEGSNIGIDEKDLPDRTVSERSSKIPGGITIKSSTAYGISSHAEGVQTLASGYSSHTEGKCTTASGENSHAEGNHTVTPNYSSHAEGSYTIASGEDSHAEGESAEASGYASHAGGIETTASGEASYAEGLDTIASGDYSHAEGEFTLSSSETSHAEGKDTTASGTASHAEGYKTTASSSYQHVQGKYNIDDASNKYAYIVGNGNGIKEDPKQNSNAHTLDWDGNAWYQNDILIGGLNAEDPNAISLKRISNKTASDITATVPTSLPSETKNNIQGILNVLSKEINDQSISGIFSSVYSYPPETCKRYATQDTNWSPSEIIEDNSSWIVNGIIILCIKCENENNYITIQKIIQKNRLHPLMYWISQQKDLEGKIPISASELSATIPADLPPETKKNVQSILNALNVKINQLPQNIKDGTAEGSIGTIGSDTGSLGKNAFSSGKATIASGIYSTATGYNTVAAADSSFAEGDRSIAGGKYSHAEGKSTIADPSGESQHVQGKFNKALGSKIAHIVGNGTGEFDRSNAHTLDWDGNAWFQGKVKIGGTGWDDPNAVELGIDRVKSVNQKTGHIILELKDLNSDSTHRLVSDTEKENWNSKQPAGDYATNDTLNSSISSLNSKNNTQDEKITQLFEQKISSSTLETLTNDMTQPVGWDSTKKKLFTKPGQSYTLLKATESTLGGVKVIPATSKMTKNVGIDNNGLLKIEPAEANDYIIRNLIDGSPEGSVGTINSCYNSLGINSFSEGSQTEASGDYSHAEGEFTIASKDCSHAEGESTQATGISSHAEGNSTEASGFSSHAEGWSTIASGDYSHAEGDSTKASDRNSHAEGYNTIASGFNSHAEGNNTIASGSNSHTEGSNLNINSTILPDKIISEENSKIPGGITISGSTAIGINSHAEGTQTLASGYSSHTEGLNSVASGNNSHAEGYGTTASGNHGSHAEGIGTTASGDYSSHAEGAYTTASGWASHVEGRNTIASGIASHAEGDETIASGSRSHAEGKKTTASSDYQHVQGKYNIDDAAGKYVHIVGNGNGVSKDPKQYSDAHTLDWDGNAWFQGKVKIGGTNWDDPNAIELGIDKVKSVNQKSGDVILKLNDLEEDSTHRLVSDIEKEKWNNKQPAGDYITKDILNSSINPLNSKNNTQDEKIAQLFEQKISSSDLEIVTNDMTQPVGWDSTKKKLFTKSGQSCTLSKATDSTLGGVKAIPATSKMTEDVGIDNNGLLKIAPARANDYIIFNLTDGFTNGSIGMTSSSYELLGENSFSEGNFTAASGISSHAEGENTEASGEASHAEGFGTIASNNTSHAEGEETLASGQRSHTEGIRTEASGDSSHAEGYNTTASGNNSHTEGESTVASGYNSHAEGSNIHTDNSVLPDSTISEKSSKIPGGITISGPTAIGINSHAEGTQTLASGYSSHTEGRHTVASGNNTHAEGSNSRALGPHSHAEGTDTIASEYSSHAEGESTTASGYSSHAEGYNTTASGVNSHAEGESTDASGEDSHAEGAMTISLGDYSHAEGESTQATGFDAHAEGSGTEASGDDSHTEGQYTIASGTASHAEGYCTTATSYHQHVQGRYNIDDAADKYAHIVGNGNNTTPSNAHTLDWDGNAWFAGGIKVGGTGWDDGILATLPPVTTADNGCILKVVNGKWAVVRP